MSETKEFESILNLDDVYRVVSSRLNCIGENARTIKYKIQQVIEDLLFDEIIQKQKAPD